MSAELAGRLLSPRRERDIGAARELPAQTPCSLAVSNQENGWQRHGDELTGSGQSRSSGIRHTRITPLLAESLASAGYPSSYFYAMSKAALDMGAKRGVITVLLSPGAVDTDMQRTIRSDMAQAGKPITSPTRTPAEVAHALVLAIEQLTPEQNGKFYSLAGKEVPW